MSVSAAMLSCCGYRPSAWQKKVAVSLAAQVGGAVVMKWKASWGFSKAVRRLKVRVDR
jgi:hypothetical protein